STMQPAATKRIQVNMCPSDGASRSYVLVSKERPPPDPPGVIPRAHTEPHGMPIIRGESWVVNLAPVPGSAVHGSRDSPRRVGRGRGGRRTFRDRAGRNPRDEARVHGQPFSPSSIYFINFILYFLFFALCPFPFLSFPPPFPLRALRGEPLHFFPAGGPSYSQ